MITSYRKLSASGRQIARSIGASFPRKDDTTSFRAGRASRVRIGGLAASDSKTDIPAPLSGTAKGWAGATPDESTVRGGLLHHQSLPSITPGQGLSMHGGAARFLIVTVAPGNLSLELYRVMREVKPHLMCTAASLVSGIQWLAGVGRRT